jgi:uncharacterized phage protein gp47/JayE
MMDFKPQTEAELLQTMVDTVSGNTDKINDFTEGSSTRSILRAVSGVVATLYHKVHKAIKDAIEDAIYNAFNFPADPGRKATTSVTFSRSTNATQNYVIAAGTLIGTSDDVLFETDSTVTLAIGTTSITATATAVAVGGKYNVQAGAISVLKMKPAGIEAVTNTAAVINGKDTETREQRQKRFQDYVAGFSRGTPAALKLAAMQVPGVVAAEVVENPALTVLISGAGSYQDVSGECNLPFGTGVDIAATSVGEALYVGALSKFNMIWFQIQQASTGGAGVWEYYNGTTWAALTVTDNTTKFTTSGALIITVPGDWAANKVNNVFCFWARYRLTTTFTIVPKAYHLFAPPVPGWVDLYIQDVNATADATLKSAVQTALTDYRGHGISVNVRAPSIRAINVTANVVVAEGYDKGQTADALEAGVTDYLNAFMLGENLYTEMLKAEIIRVSRGAVQNVTLTTPITDILTSSGEIVRPGIVTVLVTN